jgi:predicted secreted protein
MVLKNNFLVCFAGILILGAPALWAGDSASFVDLGFSPDGGFYMFGQYGVQDGLLRPWADLYIVDVARNNFVSGGRVSYTHDRPILAGQDGSGALFRLIARNAALAERYGVNFPNQGQPLYIALDDESAYTGETIEFRDFESGASYRANLVASIEGSGDALASSFYINLESVPKSGRTKKYTIGTPQLKRPHISAYHIKKVLIAPPGDSLIFVIEMKRQTGDGPDIRYMVEALRL